MKVNEQKHWLCTVRLPNAFRLRLNALAAEKSAELKVKVTRSDVVRMILESALPQNPKKETS